MLNSIVSSIHLDWLSASYTLSDKGHSPAIMLQKWNEYLQQCPIHFRKLFECDGWENAKGRRPYSGGYHNHENGIYVWLGGHGHILVEITGRGCEVLRDAGELMSVALFMSDNATRVDIAIDMETDALPSQIVALGVSARIKARNSVQSASGLTEYIGSRASQKQCRIYRYFEPHPRHELLRCEFQVRKPDATAAIQQIALAGISYTAQAFINSFELKGMPKVDFHNETAPATRKARDISKTELWLRTQVAAAFKSCVEKGEILEPEKWIEEYFLTPLYDDDGNRQSRLL
jgi:DNA relaxase NicK